MRRGVQSSLGLGQVVLGRFELKCEFGELLAEVTGLFLKDSSVFGLELFDRVLVELSELRQRSSRFSSKILEINTVLGLDDRQLVPLEGGRACDTQTLTLAS